MADLHLRSEEIKIMNIHLENVRLGFACNSSSSHSMIFAKPGEVISDDHEGGSFGWESFVCFSEEAKSIYLAATLHGNLYQVLSSQAYMEAIVRQTMSPHLSKDVLDEIFDSDYGPTIDHQSRIDLPMKFSRDELAMEYFEDVKNFILQQNLVIQGGNDNEEGYRVVDGEPANFPGLIDNTYQATCRKDGDWWTVFDIRTGNRWTFSFKKDPAPMVARSPFLVDVKITDFCPYGCTYCYQGSTCNGKHADDNDIGSLAYKLGHAETFEVAIGGGEPTLHPGFKNIIESFHMYKVTPNFTTRNLAYIKSEEFLKVVDKIGRVAFSLDNTHVLRQVVAAFVYHGLPMDKLSVQCIEGIVNPYTFKEMLHICHDNGVNLTLLGYKETERGATHKRDNEKLNWIKMVQESAKKICIDTVLAQKYEKELAEAKVPKYLYHVTEGTYSMYIDAVEKRYAKSSFVKPEEYIPFSKARGAYDSIESMFANINK